MTRLNCEGYILLPCCLSPSQEDRIPPQTLKNGAGAEHCLEGCGTSGLASWSEDPPHPPPPRLYIEGTKLSWELSECRQGPTQDRSHLRTDAGYLPGVQGRPLRKERHPSTDHGKDSLWLSQLSHSPPETSVGPCSSQGDKQTWRGGGGVVTEWASPRPCRG